MRNDVRKPHIAEDAAVAFSEEVLESPEMPNDAECDAASALNGEAQKRRDKYKQEQQARLDGLLPGADDLLGNTIKKVLARGDEYVVYEIETTSPIEALKVRIDTQIEEDVEPIKRFQKVKNELDKFKSVLYKTGADESYKYRAATAVTVAMQGETDDAICLFRAICKEARQEYREKQTGRLFYFAGALSLVISVTLGALVAYLGRRSELVIANAELFAFGYAAAFAAIGGLVSVSMRLDKLNIGQELSKWEYAAYGAERILFAILGGIIIFTLLKAKLVLEPLINSANDKFGILAFCFVAGFSETLIPNALSKLENNSGSNPAKKK